MTRAVFAVLASALALAAEAQTYTSEPATLTFVAVDGVRHYSSDVYVTGVLDGAASSGEERIRMSGVFADKCERFLLLAMTKPGQYLVTIKGTRSTTTYPTTVVSYVSPNDCRLARATP